VEGLGLDLVGMLVILCGGGLLFAAVHVFFTRKDKQLDDHHDA
jgi:hypothetical protein